MKTKSSAELSMLIFVTLLLCDALTAFAQTPTLRTNGKIAFTSDRDGNPEIYIMNPDGSDQVRLTNNSGVDVSPSWSPDGRKIAFASQKQDDSFAIFTMDAYGNGRTEVTPLNGSRLAQEDSIYTRWKLLSWSPDGRRIAFHDYSDASKSIDIFIVNTDGTGRRNLTVDHGHLDLTPTWSPDGSKILFSRYEEYPYFGTMLHTINADGTNLTRLENAFADGWNEDAPDWSPVANKIVYSVHRWDFVFDLYIANPDGTGRQFFQGCDWIDNSCKFDALTPAFSPDGAKIVFSMMDFFNRPYPTSLFVKNLDGTGLTLLTDNGFGPSWQPVATTTCLSANPIDCADFFAHQQYLDFLNREPDAPGLAHWTNEITMCSDPANRIPGETEAHCVDRKRTNTSGAFYLSNEFQNSANYLIRINWGSLGQDRAAGRKCIDGQYSSLDAVCNPLYSLYITDMATLTQGIVANDALVPSQMTANRISFANQFVGRSNFTEVYGSLSDTQYVDTLAQTTGIALTSQERSDLITQAGAPGSSCTGFTGFTSGRACVLYKIIDGTTTNSDGSLQFNTRYGQAYYQQEFNPAFVFVQYLGYLRRNPDQGGYDHWLGKLNFYGNFVDAEMVRAFLVSDEYRQRFGPQ